MNNFESIYNKLKEVYIYNNGLAKFNKIEAKIKESSRLESLYQRAAQHGAAPTGGDFSSCIQNIGYFMMSGAQTCAMADLIAMRHWNQKYNVNYRLCSDDELCKKAHSSLGRWQIDI